MADSSFAATTGSPTTKKPSVVARASRVVACHAGASLALIVVLLVIVVALYARSRGLFCGRAADKGRAKVKARGGASEADQLIDAINRGGSGKKKKARDESSGSEEDVD